MSNKRSRVLGYYGWRILLCCNFCKKEFFNSIGSQRKSCSEVCQHKYFSKNKISAFYNNESKSLVSKRTQRRYKKEKKGFYNVDLQKRLSIRASVPEVRKKAFDTTQRNKVRGIFHNGIQFQSAAEVTIAKYFESKGVKIVIYKNYQKQVGSSFVDFYVNKTFVEFHQIPKFWNSNDTLTKYRIRRRRLLNKFGYQNYDFVCLSSLKHLEEKLNKKVFCK